MKTNLVLSGGGVRGFAHLGVIKALSKIGVQINAISGTSSGAVVGAFTAAGISPDETLDLFKHYNILNSIQNAFKSGILSMKQFEKIYKNFFPDDSFEALNFPLFISATDFINGKTTYFNSGELIPTLLASTSVPVLFKPVKIKGDLFLDGGILNNLPVEPFLANDFPIIGVHVNPVSHVEINSAFKIMERSFHLAVYSNVIERMKKCSFLIEPPQLANYQIYSYSKADEIFQIGFDFAMAKRPQIEAVFQK